MRPLLDHEAPRHDGDDVRVLNGGQAMGDDDAGATLSGFVQRFLHRLPRGEKTHTHTHRQEAALAIRTHTQAGAVISSQRSLTITAISQSCIDYYHQNASVDQHAAEAPFVLSVI